MKKILNLISIAPIAIAPISTLTINSCSKQSLLQVLEQSTINEFKELAKIPHSSDEFLYKVPGNSNVKALSDYLKTKAQKLTKFSVNQDEYSNIWFDVPCNDDKYSNYPKIALQAHMDMVFTFDPSKYEKGKEPDPKTTSIDLVEETINGKRVIHSKDYKTSIGGDDGIGIAAILALISNNDVKHGDLRIIFTNCEENAMQGAMMMIDGHRDDKTKQVVQPATVPHLFQGVKYVINMDSGIGEKIAVSCSGAIGSRYSKKFNVSTPTLPNKFRLSITGFTGGHSGGAPRQSLGNPIKAAFEVLTTLTKNVEISSILTPGTTVYNRVPQNCTIEFATDATENEIYSAIATVKDSHSDPEGQFYYKDINNANFKLETINFDKCLSAEDSLKIMNLHTNLFYGYDKQAMKEKGIKTSANVGPVTLTLINNQFDFKSASYSRSDDEEKVNQFKDSNLNNATSNGIDYMCDAQFHPWVEDTNKSLYNLTKEALISVGIDSDKIQANKIHSGIEPSWWSYAMKTIEGTTDGACTCIGVNVANEHEFTETIDVESIQKCMKVAMYMLTNANKLA